MLLSIIIPAYNAEPYIWELLTTLEQQITPEVEVIVIDDGSKKPLKLPERYTWAKLITQKNQGVGAARNAGIRAAKGDYIAFIDADDLVVEDYISRLINVIKCENPDYIYMSWKSFPWAYEVRLKSLEDKFPPFNLCVWNRVYKRSMIGDVRFNTQKKVAEDAQFIRDVKEEGKKKAFIPEIMYLYRSDTPDSLTKRVTAGTLEHKRIVYNLPEVKEDPELLKEVIEADKTAEVIILTNNNMMPELEKYAMVITPREITGTELRGEWTHLFRKQPEAYRTQVVLYIDNLYVIGGIETFTYNFVKTMHKYYDIAVVYCKNIAKEQLRRLLPYADVIKADRPICCNVAINCRINLVLPATVHADKKINLVHTCKMQPNYRIADDPDEIYFVSETCKESFGIPGGVIYNLTVKDPVQRPIRLVSACRLTWEKGQNRIIELAKRISALGILYTWEVFTSEIPKLSDIPDGLVFRKQSLDVRSYIAAADFYVSPSDWESFGFSMVEALELGVPVISTPLPVLKEIGFIEGQNGFVIPFDIKELGDHYLKTILSSELTFKYSRKADNERIVKQWQKILGDTTPKRKRVSAPGCVWCVALKDINDQALGRSVKAGDYVEMPEKRAKIGAERGCYAII